VTAAHFPAALNYAFLLAVVGRFGRATGANPPALHCVRAAAIAHREYGPSKFGSPTPRPPDSGVGSSATTHPPGVADDGGIDRYRLPVRYPLKGGAVAQPVGELELDIVTERRWRLPYTVSAIKDSVALSRSAMAAVGRNCPDCLVLLRRTH
jgi:hypothetical protein